MPTGSIDISESGKLPLAVHESPASAFGPTDRFQESGRPAVGGFGERRASPAPSVAGVGEANGPASSAGRTRELAFACADRPACREDCCSGCIGQPALGRPPRVHLVPRRGCLVGADDMGTLAAIAFSPTATSCRPNGPSAARRPARSRLEPAAAGRCLGVARAGSPDCVWVPAAGHCSSGELYG